MYSGLSAEVVGNSGACQGGAGEGALLFDVFHQLSRADFAAVHVALGINRQTLCRASSLHFEWVGDAIEDLAVFEAADTNPSLPSRVWNHTVGFRVGHIDHVAPDVDAAWATELLPLAEVRPTVSGGT